MAGLANAKLQTIVWSADIGRSKDFYSNVLGLAVVGQSHGALVYQVGDSMLRVSPVPTTSPSEHTVFGFEVADVVDEAVRLHSKGVVFERFPGFAHDEDGVWRAPDGTFVAWFRDPDGNLISIVAYGVA